MKTLLVALSMLLSSAGFPAVSQWESSTGNDAMGRAYAVTAVTSTNTLLFDFPYQGSQHGTLSVRESARWGTDVMVSIERGQFLCGIEDCTVNVRFDQGPIQQFSAVEPSDRSTNMLFIHTQSKFTSELSKAKVARIEATFYQEGLQTLEFNVEGFSLTPVAIQEAAKAKRQAAQEAAHRKQAAQEEAAAKASAGQRAAKITANCLSKKAASEREPSNEALRKEAWDACHQAD